jgi:hypothetical protein
MPIKVTCSNCGGVLHAPDDAGGKRGRCPTCGNILPIPAEAPRASAASLPEPPKGGAQRSPSFGDFAIGPQVGAPPGGASDSDLAPASARSSIPGIGDAPRADPRKASMPTFADSKPEPRRATDPFARKGSATSDGAPSEGVVKAWRRAKGGLGWVQFAVFLFLIPAVALPGQMIGEHFAFQSQRADLDKDIAKHQTALKGHEDAMKGVEGAKLLSDKDTADAISGIRTATEKKNALKFLGDAEFPVMKLPQSTAIPVLVATVPTLLGLICLLIGRLGFSNVPRRACAKGPALLSVLATIIMLAGALGLCFPSVAYLFTKDPPPSYPTGADVPTGPVTQAVSEAMPIMLFDTHDPSGLIQRFGMLLGAVMLVVGEFWFASALGRVGAHLSDARTAGRVTRYVMLLGLAVVFVVGVVGLAPTEFGFGASARDVAKDASDQVVGLWKQHVTPLIDKLGENKPVLKPGVFLLGGLLLGVIYLRMVGATRGAIRGWLDRNGA